MQKYAIMEMNLYLLCKNLRDVPIFLNTNDAENSSRTPFERDS